MGSGEEIVVLLALALLALCWSFIERGRYQIVQLIVSKILARLLLLDEFVLIAILIAFIIIANILVDSGLDEILMQKQYTTHIEVCSVFYFNILLSILIAAILNLIGPLIAAFYGDSNKRILPPFLHNCERFSRALNAIYSQEY